MAKNSKKASKKEEVKENKTVINETDILDDMKNVSMMTHEESVELKEEVEKANAEHIEEVRAEKAAAKTEENIVKEESALEVVEEKVEAEINKDEEIDNEGLDKLFEQLEEENKEEVITEEPKTVEKPIRRRTMREAYGYDFMGWCYDD